MATITARAGWRIGRAGIRVSQDDLSFGCHLPKERCILRTAVNLERLVEDVIKYRQGNVARMVGADLHGYQGTVEGLALLCHVLILKLLVPQSDETLFYLLLARVITLAGAAAHAQQEHGNSKDC